LKKPFDSEPNLSLVIGFLTLKDVFWLRFKPDLANFSFLSMKNCFGFESAPSQSPEKWTFLNLKIFIFFALH